MIKVTNIVQFKRHTNLLPYYDTQVATGRCVDTEAMRSYYAKERDVTLMLIFGRTVDGTQVAKIKCPINPLPIIGEFSYTNPQGMIDLIKGFGWEVDSTPGIGTSSLHVLIKEIEESKENWEKEKKVGLTF